MRAGAPKLLITLTIASLSMSVAAAQSGQSAPRLVNGIPVAAQKDLITQEVRRAAAAGEFGNAMAAIDRYLALNDGWTTELAMLDAENAFAAGKYQRAEDSLKAYFKGATRDDPDYTAALALYPRVQAALATAMTQRKAMQAAAATLENSMYLVDGSGFIGNDLTHPHLPMPATLVRVDAFLKKWPGSAYGHAVRGELLARVKRFAEARAAYDRAASIGNYSFTHKSRGNIDGLDSRAEQVEHIVQAVTLRRATYRWGVPTLTDTPGAIDRIAALYTADIAAKPTDGDLILKRAWFYRGQGRNDSALADISAAIRLSPADVDLYRTRASFYRDIKRPDLAIADYSAVIARLSATDGMSGSAYWHRGDAHLEAGRPREAIADYDRALSNEGSNAAKYIGFWRKRAEAKTAIGDTMGAAADNATAQKLVDQETALRTAAAAKAAASTAKRRSSVSAKPSARKP